MTLEFVGIAGQGIGQDRPPFGHIFRPVLHMIRKPKRIKRRHGPVEIRIQLFHQAGPDIETNWNGHGILLVAVIRGLS